ncbi:hypothetical protein LTR86_001997 [Recurvomyces mirabilis]|nr:hypothetical protein LTR86_001997 [Recurvomyces mirabilis]
MAGTVLVEPLQHEDLERYVELYWNAFKPIEADMLLPMIYPMGLLPEVQETLCQRVIRETGGKIGEQCFVARDSTTREIIGVSWWATPHDPPRTEAEINAALEKAKKARKLRPPVAGSNIALAEEAYSVSMRCEYETMQGRPYTNLRLLAVNPSQQRRGAGSLLLKHGLEKFAGDLPVYIVAGMIGKPLYERYGFKVMKENPFDGREYGGRSAGKHWCMVRPAAQ